VRQLASFITLACGDECHRASGEHERAHHNPNTKSMPPGAV
jgi:hypothetical protein